MLLLDNPSKLMLGYLLGAYVTSITLLLVIVFSASNSSTTSTTENTLSPAVDIALGAIALVGAWFVWSGRHERFMEGRRARKAAKPDKDPPRWRRELSKGSPRTTFLVGMLLTLPGASYLAGLDEISKLNYSTTVTVLVVIGFNLVMLWLLEVPLVSFVIAPEWTPRDRASQCLGLPTLARVRRQRTHPVRRTDDHQRHRRARVTQGERPTPSLISLSCPTLTPAASGADLQHTAGVRAGRRSRRVASTSLLRLLSRRSRPRLTARRAPPTRRLASR